VTYFMVEQIRFISFAVRDDEAASNSHFREGCAVTPGIQANSILHSVNRRHRLAQSALPRLGVEGIYLRGRGHRQPDRIVPLGTPDVYNSVVVATLNHIDNWVQFRFI